MTIFLLLIVYVLAVLLPWYLYALAVFLMTLWYPTRWVFLIGFLIDVQFIGISNWVPWYTVGTVFALLLVEYVRPFLKIEVST